MLAFAGKRIAGFPSGKVLSGYLNLLHALLDRLPSSLFAARKQAAEEGGKGKGKAPEVIVIDDSDDEEDPEVVQKARQRVGASASTTLQDQDGDTEMSPLPPRASSSTHLTLDPRTLAFLATVHSREHLTSLLALSSRYSATSRPPLASFLLSLISTCPTKRDDIINVVMYSQVGGGGSAAGERGGGLLRELYRGYVRSGALSKLLANGAERSSAVVHALSDGTHAAEWSTLILLSELYSRCLLTLGDDEFFDPARSPLSLDEVVGLSGVLKNLAFVLYWQEGVVLGGGGLEERKVVGMRMGVEGLRMLATTLLQQIYARERVCTRLL